MSSTDYEIPIEEVQSKNKTLELAVEKAREENSEIEETKEEPEYTEAELQKFWITIINGDRYTYEGYKNGSPYSIRTLIDEEKRAIEHYLDKSKIQLANHFRILEARCFVAMSFQTFGSFCPKESDGLIDRLEQLGQLPVFCVDIMLNILDESTKKITAMMTRITEKDF